MLTENNRNSNNRTNLHYTDNGSTGSCNGPAKIAKCKPVRERSKGYEHKQEAYCHKDAKR